MDEKLVKKIWEKASIVLGKDNCLYRKDCHGNMMYYPSYGKESEMAWMMTSVDGRKKFEESNLHAISRQDKHVIKKPIKKAQNQSK